MNRYSTQCPECARIMLRYVQADASRSLAEHELARYRPSTGSADFAELWRACESARQEHEALHLELAEHLETHGA